MSPALIKGGLALVGIGGIGLGSWAISRYVRSEDEIIKTTLKSKGYKLTSELSQSEQQAAWDKVTKTYALEVSENLKIKVGDVTSNDIKDWCISNVEKKYEESILRKATKWCVVYSTFADRLKEENKELETDENTLNTKYASLGTLTSEVNSIGADSSTSHANGNKLKKWCESKSHSSHTMEVNDFYSKFKEHCSKAVSAPRQ